MEEKVLILSKVLVRRWRIQWIIKRFQDNFNLIASQEQCVSLIAIIFSKYTYIRIQMRLTAMVIPISN